MAEPMADSTADSTAAAKVDWKVAKTVCLMAEKKVVKMADLTDATLVCLMAVTMAALSVD